MQSKLTVMTLFAEYCGVALEALRKPQRDWQRLLPRRRRTLEPVSCTGLEKSWNRDTVPLTELTNRTSATLIHGSPWAAWRDSSTDASDDQQAKCSSKIRCN